MPVTLRELTEADDPRRAELLNLAAAEPVTMDVLRDWRRTADPARIAVRLGAQDEAGHLVGYAHALRDPWNPPAEFWVHVVVEPAWRRRGVATGLWDAARRFAREHGAERYLAEVRDHLPEGLAFAAHQGFRVDRHIFESTLDLAAFDEAPFAGALDRARRAGIHTFTLADRGDTEEARRRLWALNARVAADIPGGSEASALPFEGFERQVCQAAWYRPDAEIVAADGDRWVGLTALGYFESPRPMMYQMITGVERAYRGRGLAQALKLLGVRCARRYGAAYIRTNNDSDNAPMLAVNRKLGFRPEPGYYRVVRDLA